MSYTSTSRGNLLMESLEKFFKQEENLSKILPIIKGDSKVVYRPDKPLSCGAKVWIETEGEVEVIVQ